MADNPIDVAPGGGNQTKRFVRREVYPLRVEVRLRHEERGRRLL
jgi:hypothetical protein